ncbi:MAG: sensor histidine kinase [Candidatus Dormibacteria bacterium]
MPLTLTLVAVYQQPGPHPRLLVGLLAASTILWGAWLVVRGPWRRQATSNGTITLLLLIGVAAASGAATMIDGPSWAANFAAGAALEAGATVKARATVLVPLLAGVGLAVGSLLHGASAFGLFGKLPTQYYFAFYVALFAGTALVGLARGLRQEQLVQTRRLLDERLEASAQREQAAALAERARIAREIHDILAHSLADLAIQLEVADALLSDSADPAQVLERIRHAHRLASEGMGETRRAIQALHSDSPPLPDALAALLGAYERDGGRAHMEVEGSPRPLSAAAGLAMLRIAQEALANVRKHAAGQPVEVCLAYVREQVMLTVTDGVVDRSAGTIGESGRPPGLDGVAGGFGLAGMYERLRLVGGSLTAGPVSGGWAVHAEVPG